MWLKFSLFYIIYNIIYLFILFFLQRFLKLAILHCSSLSRCSFLNSRSLPTTTTTATTISLSSYIHLQSLLKHSRSLQKNYLVVLRNNCVTWWNVLESSIIRMSAWLSSLEISRSLYLQQQLLITPECLTICRCHSKGSTFSSVVFKTLSVSLVYGFNPRPYARQSSALQHELTKQVFSFFCMRIQAKSAESSHNKIRMWILKLASGKIISDFRRWLRRRSIFRLLE